MLDVWEQEEWHGMARRGAAMRDPFSSRVEVNTEPGQDEIVRLTAREPFMSSQLASPAVYFSDPYAHYMHYEMGGESYTARDFGMSGTAFRLVMCVQTPDDREEQASTYPPLAAAAIDATNRGWELQLIRNSASAWAFRGLLREGASITAMLTMDHTLDLEASSWYWVEMRKNLSLGYFYLDV
jgi:hypothetical protein